MTTTHTKQNGRFPAGKKTENTTVDLIPDSKDATLPNNTPDASPPAQKLKAEEETRLKNCETTIGRGFGTFFEVGQAFAEIKETKLYRAEFKTFEDYCRQRWQYNRSYAYRLIGAGDVYTILSPIGSKEIPLPINECQVRPLVGLESKNIISAWRKSIEWAGNKSPSAELVKKAAAKFRKKKPSRKAKDVGSEQQAKPRTEAELLTNLVSMLREVEQEVAKLANCQAALGLLSAAKEKARELLVLVLPGTK